MSQLLEGKTAVILGVANRWSIAYAIAEAFRREGAKLILTYQGERQRLTVEELGTAVGAARLLNCDVTNEDDLAALDRRSFNTRAASIAWCIASRSRIARICRARFSKRRAPDICWLRKSAAIRWLPPPTRSHR